MPDPVSVFQEKVKEGLKLCLYKVGFSSIQSVSCAGVAVSGGADSVALLIALSKVFPARLKVVTINHGLRSDEASRDADFVVSLCDRLGLKCVRYDIPCGEITGRAKEEKTSVEDAARNVRYEKFNEFIECEGVDFLCLAHQKDDQIETLLMRFLQGSSSLRGIPFVRDKFFRPMLGISRKEIEEYLALQGIDYRTDSTNSDNLIFRNRIRNSLVPFLDSSFPGWRDPVFSLAEKSKCDDEAVTFLAEEALYEIGYTEDGIKVSFNEEKFFTLPIAVRIKIAFRGIDFLKTSGRVPYSFVYSLFDDFSKRKNIEGFGLSFSFSSGTILIKKKQKLATEKGFFVIIEKSGSFMVGDILFEVSKVDRVNSETFSTLVFRSGSHMLEIKDLSFPFVLRSRQAGDIVRNADGSFRSVSKVFDDWKVGDKRDLIPLVQRISVYGKRQHKLDGKCVTEKVESSALEIRCIWGSLFGFKDWIVK